MKQFISGLLDSKKFNIAVISINGILIIGLSCYLVVMNVKITEKDFKEEQIIRETDTEGSTSGSVDAEEPMSEEIDVEELIYEADTSMLDIYSALIRGTDFELGDGIEFHFGFNGEYAGYFDVDNTSMENCTYEVTIKDNAYVLFIYNENKNKYAEYQMSFDSNGNIILTYPGMDQSLLLEY